MVTPLQRDMDAKPSIKRGEHAENETAGLENGMAAAGIALLLCCCCTSASVSVIMPSLGVWMDVAAGMGGGIALSLLLAAVFWSCGSWLYVLALSGVLLCLPYAMPFTHGIGASAWKSDAQASASAQRERS